MLDSIPKIMHFYWDRGYLSYLQYMTIIRLNKFLNNNYNPSTKNINNTITEVLKLIK